MRTTYTKKVWKHNRTQKGGKRFRDYPEFKPNLSPKEMFRLGSFGGTYWRPIYSHVTKQHYKNIHQKTISEIMVGRYSRKPFIQCRL
jgi:hypothetical protein